jgi:hypothetical protein
MAIHDLKPSAQSAHATTDNAPTAKPKNPLSRPHPAETPLAGITPSPACSPTTRPSATCRPTAPR